MQDNVTQAKQDALYDGEAWAELAKEAGFRPYDTESVAREAFRFCAERITAQSEAVQRLVEALEKAVEALDYAADDLANCDEFESADFRRTQADTFRAALAAHRESQP